MDAMGGRSLAVGDYLRELVGRLRRVLGDELLGVYAYTPQQNLGEP